MRIHVQPCRWVAEIPHWLTHVTYPSPHSVQQVAKSSADKWNCRPETIHWRSVIASTAPNAWIKIHKNHTCNKNELAQLLTVCTSTTNQWSEFIAETIFGKSVNDFVTWVRLESESYKSDNTTIKETVSSRSEQTFNRAWNQCPSLRWTQWLKITGSFMQQQR